MKPLDRRHRKVLKQSAQWLHPFAKSIRESDPDKSAAARLAALLCDAKAGACSSRAAKDAICAIPVAAGADPHAWQMGLLAAIHTVNLQAGRNGIDPYVHADGEIGREADGTGSDGDVDADGTKQETVMPSRTTPANPENPSGRPERRA